MERIDRYDFEERLLKKSLVRVGDLINMDGPMLVVFQHIVSTDLYLFDWVDSDAKSNRWLIYKVDKKNLTDFLKTKISYKRLFEKNDTSFYYTDVDSQQIEKYEIFKLKEVPLEYKPDKDVLFDVKDAKNIEKIIKVLNLDRNFTLKNSSKEYNIVPLRVFVSEFPIQTYKRANSWNTKPNNLHTNKILFNRNYTQLNAQNSTRLSKQEKLVLQR